MDWSEELEEASKHNLDTHVEPHHSLQQRIYSCDYGFSAEQVGQTKFHKAPFAHNVP
jgi:hypothetical protein